MSASPIVPVIDVPTLADVPTVKVAPDEVGDPFVRRSASPTHPLSTLRTTLVLLVVLDLAMVSSHLFLASRFCARRCWLCSFRASQLSELFGSSSRAGCPNSPSSSERASPA